MQRVVRAQDWEDAIGATRPGGLARARAGGSMAPQMRPLAPALRDRSPGEPAACDLTLGVDPFAAAKVAGSATSPRVLVNDMAGLQDIGRRRHGLVFALWLAASLLLHIVPVAAFVLWPAAISDFGAIDADTEAISVEIVSSHVLEALHVEPSIEAAAQQAVVMPEGNAAFDNTAAPNAKDKPVEAAAEAVKAEPVREQAEAAPDVPAPIQVAKTEPVVEQASVTMPTPTQEPEKLEPEKPVVEQQEEKKGEQESKAPARKGAISVEATQGSVASARVSASTGQMQSYAAKVRAHIAKHKVIGPVLHGTTIVSFGITSDGELRYSKVVASSGHAPLDERALAAIKRASPFPTPPTGATPRQLTYSMPFYFQ